MRKAPTGSFPAATQLGAATLKGGFESFVSFV